MSDHVRAGLCRLGVLDGLRFARLRCVCAGLLCAGLLCVGLSLSGTAEAQHAGRCPDALARWGAACDAGDEAPRVASCPAGHAIYTVGPGALQVDVSAARERAFVTVGPLSASPIGEFPDWNAVPAADRAAFDALVECLRARPDALMEVLEETPGRVATRDATGPRRPETPLPWRMALGLLIALGLAVRRLGLPPLAKRAVPLVALSAVTMLARQLLVAENYFHQNGQGPFWIAHALGEPSSYGPGYAHVFFWAADGATDPDGAVFLVQAILCALVPSAVYAAARGAGTHRGLAWAAALAVALSPLLARLSQGESYFATCGALLTVAAAVLCVARPDDSLVDKAGVGVSAGLLVAQAALIHPVCWVAAALLPSVVLVGPGDTRPRLQLTALLTALVAGVVLFTAGADMIAVLQGSLGDQWLAPDHERQPRSMPLEILLVGVMAIGAAGLAFARPQARRGAVAASTLGGVIVAGWLANLLGSAPPWVVHAYRWMYLGPFVVSATVFLHELYAFAAKAEDTRRRRGALGAGVIALLVGALGWYAVHFEETTRVPTGAREAMLLRAWRTHLPPRAVVAHLERADRQIVGVPLYSFRTVRFRAGEAPSDFTGAGRDLFLYRPSLCTTERGRSFCEEIERTYVLQPVHRAVLPAIPSMEGLDYDRPEVEVGLYRVRDRRSGATTPDRSSEGREGR
ncbi:MAG: hypothetical protein AB8I08_26510 [Sandaracinaceae bacterium]